MRNLILICLLLISYDIAVGQLKNKQRSNAFKPFYGVFGKSSSFSLPKRLANYPFDKAAQIQLVSFNNLGISLRTREDGTVDKAVKILKNRPDLYSAICLFPPLTAVQISRLSDVFYNYGYIKKPNSFREFKCYEPRNGILFLTSEGKAFEFLEICFDFQKVEMSSEKMQLGEEMDNKKIEMLKGFFRTVGIKYGVTRKFPGQTH